MMRGRHSWGLAVRQPSGEIARRSFPLVDPASATPCSSGRWCVAWWRWSSLLALGVKALGSPPTWAWRNSGQLGRGGDGGPRRDAPRLHFGFKELALTVGVAVVLGGRTLRCDPSGHRQVLREHVFSNPFVFNLVEGLIRIVDLPRVCCRHLAYP